MRTPEESRITKFKKRRKSWSISEGDYIRKKDRGDITFRMIKSRKKKTKIFFSILFVLIGYGIMIFILSFISKV